MRIGVMFPGQGSQHVGMGKDLWNNFPVAKEVFEEAGDALKFDIKKLCFEGPESDLKLTFNTQPALLATSIAAWRVLRSEFDLKPAVALGHSLGEYSALVAIGALTLTEGMTTVRFRGQAMQDAVPVGEGGMTVVLGIEDAMIEKLCHDFQGKVRELGEKKAVLEPANFNCPGQVAVSGHLNALAFLREHFVAADYGARAAKLIPLPVSAPFHCSLMKPAAEKLSPVLRSLKWKTPECDVIHNVSGLPQGDLSQLAEILTEQVVKPVLWTSSVHKAHQEGVNTFIEIGAGRVLSGLVKKIDRNLTTLNVENVESLKLSLTALQG